VSDDFDSEVQADLAESRGNTLAADAIRDGRTLTEWDDLRCSECQSTEHRRRDCPVRRARIRANLATPLVVTLPDYYIEDGSDELPLAIEPMGMPAGGTWNPPAPFTFDTEALPATCSDPLAFEMTPAARRLRVSRSLSRALAR
jgi:hypothetical protein